MMNYFKMLAKLVAQGMLAVAFVALSTFAQTKPQPAAQAAPATPVASKAAPKNGAAQVTKKTAKKRLDSAAARKAAAPAKKKLAHRVVARPAPKKPAKPAGTAKTPAAVPPVPAAAIHPAELPELTRGRDPFAALIRASDPGAHSNLPPGIAGLQVATIQLQGMVKTSGGMVAVVANPQDRVYFLHDGDHIYDGVVEKIGLDEITFLQQSKDAFGRTVDRDVSKRLYPIAGDEQ